MENATYFSRELENCPKRQEIIYNYMFLFERWTLQLYVDFATICGQLEMWTLQLYAFNWKMYKSLERLAFSICLMIFQFFQCQAGSQPQSREPTPPPAVRC